MTHDERFSRPAAHGDVQRSDVQRSDAQRVAGRRASDEAEVEPELAALLGALASDGGRRGAEVRAAEHDADLLARLEAELATPRLADELASHRALVSELRALPERAPSPDWRALEASIRQACDEVPAKRRWSWAALRGAWSWPRRVPTWGLGAAAMASLALLLWQRAPRPAEESGRAPDAAVRAEVAPSAAPVAVATPGDDEAALFLDDELVLGSDLDDRGVGDLLRQLPAAAAITLGAGGEASGDGDDDLDEVLLPGGSFDDELEQLDTEALRALDQWLEAEQKG